ncbi:DNA polymerase [Xanthomonas phage X1]|nr:DNA polymerase [Xanthomonas phage X1]
MAFYTFCDSIGSKIYHRYVDDAGKRHQEIVTSFPIELFIKGNGEYKSLYGDRLSRMTFDTISDAKDFIKKYEGTVPVFGQTSMHHQFISHRYPEKIELQFDKYRVLNFDIETRFDGKDDEDEVLVRKVFSLEEETVTVGYMKTLQDVWEVYDPINERWYPASKAPQRNPGGFPDAQNAAYEITSISCKVFGRPQKVTFGTKEYEVKDKNQIYNLCADERELLQRFIDFVRLVDPDAITGWNIESFDVPYIVNRCRALLGEKLTNKLSPFHAHTDRCIQDYWIDDDKTEKGYRIFGVTTLDYMDMYKGYNPVKRDSYALDFISEVELKEKKLDYSEYGDLMGLYRQNYEKFIDYNERDVYLVERLDQKKQFVRLVITTVLMTKSRYQEKDGKVKLWDNLIYNLLKAENIVIPPAVQKHGRSIIGAYVKEPVPGKYRWVSSLDLTSLYPSICMMFNMSPETLVREEQGQLDWVERLLKGEDLAADCRAQGWAMAANGSAYRQDVMGVMPKGMKFVFDTRKAEKNRMLDLKREKEAYLAAGGTEGSEEYLRLDNLIAAADATQGAMKVLANSGYGASANKGFRYFNVSIAEGITLTGQLGIQYIGNMMNKYLNKKFGTEKDYVITSDTDSAYIQLENLPSDPKNIQKSVDEIDDFLEKEFTPFINAAYQKLSDRLGAKKNLLDMKREAIADVGIFRGKKNYVLRVWDNEHVRYHEPVLKMTGIETARSDKPMMVRKKLESDLEILLTGTQEQLLTSIDSFKKEFYNAPIENIASPKGVKDLTKWIGDSGELLPKAPYHVRAAYAHNTLIIEKGLQKTVERIKNGNKVRLMALKAINPCRCSNIAFNGTLPEGFDLHEYLDKDKQWNATYITPLKSFTEILGWKTEKVSSLESLFG